MQGGWLGVAEAVAQKEIRDVSEDSAQVPGQEVPWQADAMEAGAHWEP